MDGALTPVNSPAVTLNRRHQPAAHAAQSHAILQGMMQSGSAAHSWESARQQSAAAQSKTSKSPMQEMDSLLAAEKVGCPMHAIAAHPGPPESSCTLNYTRQSAL